MWWHDEIHCLTNWKHNTSELICPEFYRIFVVMCNGIADNCAGKCFIKNNIWWFKKGRSTTSQNIWNVPRSNKKTFSIYMYLITGRSWDLYVYNIYIWQLFWTNIKYEHEHFVKIYVLAASRFSSAMAKPACLLTFLVRPNPCNQHYWPMDAVNGQICAE